MSTPRNAPNETGLTSKALLVLTTCADAAEAATLADWLVQCRLAACVNRIDSMRSTYHWQGVVEHATESLLLIKTTLARYPQVEQAIRERSTYAVPEVLAIEITDGLPAYLDWLGVSVKETNPCE